MTLNEHMVRYSRLGLILAAFALVSAIIAQPLWASLSPTGISASESSQNRVQ